MAVRNYRAAIFFHHKYLSQNTAKISHETTKKQANHFQISLLSNL